MSIGYGGVCGWPSANLPTLLDADQTPLAFGVLNLEQASWVGSLFCVGGFLGNWLFMWSSERFGRKLSMIATAVAQIIGWLMIIFATTPVHLYAARLLLGFSGGGVFVLVPMFVTEIADDRVRGVLGSLLVFSCNIGILFGFVLSNYFSYETYPLVMVALPAFFLVGFAFLPESPQFLVQRGRDKEATRSLQFYRNVRQDSTDAEAVALKSQLNKLRVQYQTDDAVGAKDSTLRWADFCTRSSRKALLLGSGLVLLNQLCGVFAMLNYTSTIFAEAGSDMTPNMAAIVIGVIQLAGAYMSTLLVDRAGRKFLLALSSLGTALGLGTLGAYLHLKELGHELHGWGWLPLVCFSFVVFIASWGVLTLPFLVIAEIMPEKVGRYLSGGQVFRSWLIHKCFSYAPWVHPFAYRSCGWWRSR